MMNITPLLTPAQPTVQPTATAGSNQGSESTFGEIFGQKMTEKRSAADKPTERPKSLSATDSPSSSKQGSTESETAENTPLQETDITTAATEATTASSDARQFDTAEISEAQGTLLGIIATEQPNQISKPSPSLALFEISKEITSQSNAVDKSGNSSKAVTLLNEVSPVSDELNGLFTSNSATAEKNISVAQTPSNSVEQIFTNPVTTKDHNSLVTTVTQPNINTSNLTADYPSSLSQRLWPADASLTGKENITISGYLANSAEQKSMHSSALSMNHLVIIAEQTPVTVAAISQAPTHAPQQTAAETAPLMISLNQLTTLKSPGVESQEKYRPLTVEPLRQQFHEQQMQIKTEAKGNEENSQQFPSKQETATAQVTVTSQNSATNTAGQSLSFSEISQTNLVSTQGNSVPASPQPLSPPAQLSPVVHESNILQQVAERFQMQMRNQETTLRIQLQPAELGKLDINLTIKEGSIRAHVVAQSGQVQELLERNMTRLKGILENQGFSIEEILVSTRSESISNTDLFHDQTTRHQQPATTKSHFSDTPFSDTLDSIVTSGIEPAISVNITA